VFDTIIYFVLLKLVHEQRMSSKGMSTMRKRVGLWSRSFIAGRSSYGTPAEPGARNETNIGTTGFKGIEFLFPFFLCHEQNHAQAPYPFRHAHVVRQHDDKRLELGIQRGSLCA
jgi:hypothetical protein